MYFKNCLSFIFFKDLLFALTFCLKKYLFTCCEILTDDERKIRNNSYHIMLCIAVFLFLVDNQSLIFSTTAA